MSYINDRINDKIKTQIEGYTSRINNLFKTRHKNLNNYKIDLMLKLISFEIRNLKVWRELHKRNKYYEIRLQNQKEQFNSRTSTRSSTST